MGGKISISRDCCNWLVSRKDQANDLYDVHDMYDDVIPPVKSLGLVLNRLKMKYMSRV